MDAVAVSQQVDGCIYVKHSKEINSIAQDVIQGLMAPPRSLPAKYFYDERGSRLFDRICETEEYYPTRIESTLLEQHAQELIEQTRPEHILEFGSGTSRKTHHLIRACEETGLDCEYLPFDVCEEMLQQVHNEFTRRYGWLDVKPLVGDYTAGLEHLHRPDGHCLYVFLGSSIGNFSQQEASAFVSEVAGCMRSGDSFLLGVDRVKDEEVLHRAYNDSAGVTSEFNLNVLNVLNEELDANFNTDHFRHRAIYNSQKQRIEMYLVSQRDQSIELESLDEVLQIEHGERILTEVSHKYHYRQAEKLMTDAGLDIVKHVEPDNAWFSLVMGTLP